MMILTTKFQQNILSDDANTITLEITRNELDVEELENSYSEVL